MAMPSEHKTVQARILAYAQEIGWIFVPRGEAETRRNFDKSQAKLADQAKAASPFFIETLFNQVKAFNPDFADSAAELARKLTALPANIRGNRAFLRALRGQSTFFDPIDARERDLKLIDFDIESLTSNRFEVTEEFYFNNGRYGNRADVVFLINGIPVLVIECKSATKDEAIALGVDQIRRYHNETPELMVPPQLFTATEAIGFVYGVTWNIVRRNLFNWKHEKLGQLEAKIKSFCDRKNLLAFLQHYILFAEKESELQKFILRQHQTGGVEKVVERAHHAVKRRGLVWHTQGSGKTFTMIKSAEMLFKAPQSEKPTILLLIDRNELEDQMARNLESLGLHNVEPATSIEALNALLRGDYRGIIVSTIHKFRDMPADLNARTNIYVLIDEAHRTTQGDLGNYLMAAIPNATFIGFTGTPIDATAHGKGTFKTFGIDDEQGYLHKYSIRESIEDRTTLPLFYALAPNELLVPREVMEKEFLALAETEGIADIEELNKILERAVNLRNFLKGQARIEKVARYVAEHYLENVEPLGYKAFLVAVDREACALYKEALDKVLPPEYSQVVYTGNNNDSEQLKRLHLASDEEKAVRRQFAKFGTYPKILIVTEKLLTGYDAPLLYAMYLDKPLRDHTLLQAIARVNRPYENEVEEMVKPHGFVLDFVGIFDKLEKALAFDSDEVSAVVKDIALLKSLFQSKIMNAGAAYLPLIQHGFNDKDVDSLIEHFRDKDRRKAFFREYKELEMLYEIISPDAFLRPFIADYSSLSAIYAVVSRAYAKRVYVDRDFQRKTNALVQQHVDLTALVPVAEIVQLDEHAIDQIKAKHAGDETKIINLVKSIEKAAEDESDDPYLVGLADRADAVLEQFEERQTTTKGALGELIKLLEENETRKKVQAEKGFDGLTFFIYRTLLDAGIDDAENVTLNIRDAFVSLPTWRESEKALRELRTKVTGAIFPAVGNVDKTVEIVDELFNLLTKAYRI
ncbi:HsdR family type I site-specific deoxyribonuclease [Pseudomonas moraviensis]|uniref:type I restriction endonuclease subunit R n=1 Tax=Pseudomonas moraviensis TaxID=321662 RepID=UPI002093C7F7|nr:HsdR family type I site-specific deoxyribonuclease [Pseudomonas moraviensis]UST58293.1 HsdR family type I site-specific deoxyribonuclease [Pseudomonas moraviensis]